MKKVTTYITEDGTSFTNQKDALEYEKELNKVKSFRICVVEEHFYEVIISAKSEEEACEMFSEDPDKYEKKNYEIFTTSIEAEEEDV